MINDKNKIINTAPIKPPLKMEKVTLDDALELLRFPIELGKYEKRNVSLCKGQYGYYLKYGDDKISLKINLSNFLKPSATPFQMRN
jgi:topoisomerase IA-like protein